MPIRTVMMLVEWPAPAGAHPQEASDAPLTNGGLLRLLTWLSPAFPVGAFSTSHGLEWGIDTKEVASGDDLEAWLADLLALGGGWTDAVLFAEAWRAAAYGDAERLADAAELAEAMAPSRERRLETCEQGAAFLHAAAAGWPFAPDGLARDGRATPYPIAVGAIAGASAIPLVPALAAYLHAFSSNLVSVAVRLVPLGQSEGVRVLASLHPLIADTAERAARSTLGDLGAATIRSDIWSMRHETQVSRVFRT